jgi:glycosyltransferase involved in cell wall biosynthesis
MRKLYFLLPGTTRQFYGGGLFAELKTLELAQQICAAEVATYRQKEDNVAFLADLLTQPNLDQYIFVVSWGFDVPKLVKKLSHCHVIYHAHSSGYGFRIPPSIPIITVSRNTMGYWGQHALNALVYYLPNCIGNEVTNRHQARDIDVLVQARKTSEYVLTQLVPALRRQCNVVVIDSFVEDLIGLFNRSKVYLYDSAEYWAQYRLTEGFGLPPMEALACGCQVFSSVNHALADYLDPGFNCYKISGYATGYDVQRILQVLQNWQPSLSGASLSGENLVEEYRAQQVMPRLKTILEEVNLFFDYQQQHESDIVGLSAMRLMTLFLKRVRRKKS